MKITIATLAASVLWSTAGFCASDNTDHQARQDIQRVDQRLSKLEHSIADLATKGSVFFLFGAFCALWAQNTGRSAWGWFFLGGLFSVLAVIFLLVKNSEDRRSRQRGFDLQQFREQ